ESIALPLGSPSMLRTAFEARMVFRGAPPEAGATLQGRLWKLLRVTQAPAEVLVAPIMLKERVVNLVYAHPAGNDQAVAALATLAQVAATGYTRLIQRAKHKA